MNIFPVGWCETNGYQLRPPRKAIGISSVLFAAVSWVDRDGKTCKSKLLQNYCWHRWIWKQAPRTENLCLVQLFPWLLGPAGSHTTAPKQAVLAWDPCMLYECVYECMGTIHESQWGDHTCVYTHPLVLCVLSCPSCSCHVADLVTDFTLLQVKGMLYHSFWAGIAGSSGAVMQTKMPTRWGFLEHWGCACLMWWNFLVKAEINLLGYFKLHQPASLWCRWVSCLMWWWLQTEILFSMWLRGNESPVYIVLGISFASHSLVFVISSSSFQ